MFDGSTLSSAFYERYVFSIKDKGLVNSFEKMICSDTCILIHEIELQYNMSTSSSVVFAGSHFKLVLTSSSSVSF